MKTFYTFLMIPLISVLALPAYADHRHQGYSQFGDRLERQQHRIKQGKKSGELTKKEVKKLKREHKHITKLAKSFKKDGHLSHYEKRTLKNELKEASNRIYKLKHNDRNRDKHHGHNKYYGHNKQQVYAKHHRTHIEKPRYRSSVNDRYVLKSKYYDNDGWSILFRLNDYF